MGFSLTRPLDAEAKYMELCSSPDDDPGSALAGEVDFIRVSLSKNFTEREKLIDLLLESREHFAQGQLDKRFRPFLHVIDLLATEEGRSACHQILVEAGARMHEFSLAKMEYLILAIVAMEKCLE